MFKKSKDDEFKIGKQILSEDDLQFNVTYNGEVFLMRHLPPYMRHNIEADIVRRLGGFNRSAHDLNHVAMVEASAYVEASVIEGECPDWFTSAWTCYDEDCIVELYKGLLQFRSDFRDRITGKQPEKNSRGSKS